MYICNHTIEKFDAAKLQNYYYMMFAGDKCSTKYVYVFPNWSSE